MISHSGRRQAPSGLPRRCLGRKVRRTCLPPEWLPANAEDVIALHVTLAEARKLATLWLWKVNRLSYTRQHQTPSIASNNAVTTSIRSFTSGHSRSQPRVSPLATSTGGNRHPALRRRKTLSSNQPSWRRCLSSSRSSCSSLRWASRYVRDALDGQLEISH